MNKQLIAYILITIVFLVVFGGIASVLPSRQARQLGRLRVSARKYGLTTSLVHIADVNASLSDRVTASGKRLDPKKRCVTWSKPYADDFPDVPEWITYALDQKESSNMNWQLHETTEECRNLADSYWLEVDQIKSLFPERCIAIECTRTEVRWLGYEKVHSTMDEFIQAMLQGLDSLIRLNTSISEERIALKKRLETDSEYD
ncbi:MAG: hypothetical protein F4077_01405 [Gammaproteobacteria bacterium]|nr:hypothetical protein [Gammaproteobacteria bacterium]MYI76411.1 hypothetical protein [Gammaproteobacteria bacterium]